MSEKPSLVLVESPAKAKLLEKYLKDRNCKVVATIGHMYDLERNSTDFGIKIENGKFKPRYILIKGKEDIKKQIERELKNSSTLYIATDGDREGEAIGAHLVEQLKPNIPVKRVVFYEIVPKVVLKSFDEPREIDVNLVKAQEARRILDRIYGFKISKALWSQISYQLSVGRVQSVVLKELIDREVEIFNHVERRLYGVKVEYEDEQIAKIKTVDGRQIASTVDFDNLGILQDKDKVLLEESTAEEISRSIESVSLKNTSTRKITHSPKPPFNTASIQIAAFTRFGMSNVRTMAILQSLYNKGHITYMRTDSSEISDEAFEKIEVFIKENVADGAEIVSEGKRSYSKRGHKISQKEAHEAIRPSLPIKSPKELGKLPKAELDIYRMIFERTLASQCKNAVGHSKHYEFECKLSENSQKYNSCSFDLSYSELDSPGFTKISEQIENKTSTTVVSAIKQLVDENNRRNIFFVKTISATMPKPRYNFGSIVKYMKESNIGRPSTYSYIVNILLKHDFIKKIDGKLIPTLRSLFIVQALKLSIARYIESNFTAEMEKGLDDISKSSINMDVWLDNIYRKDRDSIVELYRKLMSIGQDNLRKVNFNNLDILITINGALFILDKDGKEKDDVERLSISNLTLDQIKSDMLDEIKKNKEFIRRIGALKNYEITVRKSHYGYYIMVRNTEQKERPKFYPIPKELSPHTCELTELLEHSDRLSKFRDSLYEVDVKKS